MGQDEDAEPLMRRTDFCRAEQTRRRRVAHTPKLSQDGLEPEGDVAGDVFEKHPFLEAFPDDPGNVGPEVAGVVGPAKFASGAEGLAGISGEDGVEGAVEDPGVECPQIVPDRGRGEIACALGGDEHGTRPVLPFDEAPGVVSGLGQHEAQIQASAACAEGQSVLGTKHHAIHRTPRAAKRSGVTSPRARIASRMLLLMVFAGRNLSEFTRSA